MWKWCNSKFLKNQRNKWKLWKTCIFFNAWNKVFEMEKLKIETTSKMKQFCNETLWTWNSISFKSLYLNHLNSFNSHQFLRNFIILTVLFWQVSFLMFNSTYNCVEKDPGRIRDITFSSQFWSISISHHYPIRSKDRWSMKNENQFRNHFIFLYGVWCLDQQQKVKQLNEKKSFLLKPKIPFRESTKEKAKKPNSILICISRLSFRVRENFRWCEEKLAFNWIQCECSNEC